MKKDFFGKLYGIRLRTESDKKMKETLLKLSNEKKIPLDKIILNYLQKGLDLEQQKEFEKIDTSDLTKYFNKFLKNSIKKIEKFGKELKVKEFEKKESLKNLVYKTYPDDLQKKILFLDILKTQILSEIELCQIIFSLYDYETEKYVDYFSFYCDVNKITPSQEFYTKLWNQLQEKIFFEWYYELKINGIILDLYDLENLRFNYEMLEKFIFNLYKGRKILLSRKEQNVNFIKDSLDSNSSEKRGYETTIWYRINGLFTEIFKFKSTEFRWLSDINYSYENYEKWKIFEEFQFKPYLFKNILNLDGYYRYLEHDEENMKAFSYGMAQYLMLYLHFNERTKFPPIKLITQISNFFENIGSVEEFLIQVQKAVKKEKYSLFYLRLIGFYLKSLESSQSSSEFAESLMKKISNENLYKLINIKPNNLQETLNILKKHLKEDNFFLDEEYEELTNIAKNTLFQNNELFKSRIMDKLKENPREYKKYKKMTKE